jgi:hypothetical protein
MDDETRLKVWRRDGFKCVYCGYDARGSFEKWWHSRLTVDHLKPRARGGTDDLANYVTACGACNAAKHAHDFASVDEAKRWVRLYQDECAQPWYAAHVVRGEPLGPSEVAAARTRLLTLGNASKRVPITMWTFLEG